MHIFGGQVYGAVRVGGNGQAHFYGYGLELTDGLLLTGTLADGNEIEIQTEVYGNGQILLHEVPEPSVVVGLVSLALVGLTLRSVRRRRR